MKEAPVFRFFFTPLEWIFFVLLALGVCAYITYPWAKEYVTKIICSDLQNKLKITQNELGETKEKLKTTQNELLETQNELANTKKELEETQEKLRKWRIYGRNASAYQDYLEGTADAPKVPRPSFPEVFF